MTQDAKWPKIAVVGAGAVGSYFGGMLARAGAPVLLIGRNPHIETIVRSGLVLNSLHFQETILIAGSTSMDQLRDAEVVLVCVKSYDTEETARSMVTYLSSKATVVSLQNGVDNVDRIRAVSGIEALAAAVYVAVERSAPGEVRHTGAGNLAIGDFWTGARTPGPQSEAVKTIADLFIRAGVSCRVSQDIRADLWVKLVMNCAYNAISALCRARYGPLSENPCIRNIMRQVIAEIVVLAEATGVKIPSVEALMESALKLGVTMANAISSTAQDVLRGRHTEIDALNGYVVGQSSELGIAAPANQALHGLVKFLEAASAQSSSCDQ